MKKEAGFLEILPNNWWVRHLLFWIFILNYFTWGFGFGDSAKDQYLRILKFIPGFMIIVYSLLYFLIPRFLMNKKYLFFLIGFFSLFCFASLFTELFSLNFHSRNKFSGFDIKWGKNVLPFIHVAAIAVSIKFIKTFYFQENRTIKAKHQKTMAELELLKAQIHPHFLFNTLNNLFAHTLRRSPDSPRIVSGLSELLRFMIYESKEDYIPLDQEIQLLNNYIALERLRYGKELDISVSFTGDNSGKLIRPLLLLPLVENSFKHGMSQQLDSKWISLDFHIEKNNIKFKLGNSKDTDAVALKVPGKLKGIGLENVKRRLDLLYPGKHKIEINDEPDMYLVTIELQVIDKGSIGISNFKDGSYAVVAS